MPDWDRTPVEVWIEAQRRHAQERERRLREKADPNCIACHGEGMTEGYVAPSKTARYACYCTGEADWQRGAE